MLFYLILRVVFGDVSVSFSKILPSPSDSYSHKFAILVGLVQRLPIWRFEKVPAYYKENMSLKVFFVQK